MIEPLGYLKGPVGGRFRLREVEDEVLIPQEPKADWPYFHLWLLEWLRCWWSLVHSESTVGAGYLFLPPQEIGRGSRSRSRRPSFTQISHTGKITSGRRRIQFLNDPYNLCRGSYFRLFDTHIDDLVQLGYRLGGLADMQRPRRFVGRRVPELQFGGDRRNGHS